MEGSFEEKIQLIFTEYLGLQEQWGWTMWIGAFILLLISAVLFNLFRTLVRYYQFQLWESEGGFRLVGGLYSRQEHNIPINKVQIVEWNTNPIMKWMNRYSVRVFQAGSEEQQKKQRISIPGCFATKRAKIIGTLLQREDTSPFDRPAYGISPRIIRRYLIFYGILPAIVIALQLHSLWSMLAILWVILAGFLGRLYQRKFEWQLHPNVLTIRTQLFATRKKFLQLHKIQAVSVRQSPYQRRNQLATLQIFTAGGAVNLPYIDIESAEKLRDHLLMKVEAERREWM